jgi:hypothetical protein
MFLAWLLVMSCSVGSAAPHRARAAFRELEVSYHAFDEALLRVDTRVRELRLSRLREAEPESIRRLATRIQRQRRSLTQRWTKLRERYSEIRQMRIDVHQPGLTEGGESEDFLLFLSLARQDRSRMGSSQNLLARLWRGLPFGESLDSLPHVFSHFAQVPARDGLGRKLLWALGPGDFLVVSTVNGGVVKGEFLGEIDHDWIVREHSELSLTSPYRRF